MTTGTETAVEFITSESIRAKNLVLDPPAPNKTVNRKPIFELDNPVWGPSIKLPQMIFEVEDKTFWSIESAINTTLVFNFGSALVTKRVPPELTKPVIDFAKNQNKFVEIPLHKLTKDGYDSIIKSENVKPIRRFQSIPRRLAENIGCCSAKEQIKVENFIARCEDKFFDRATIASEKTIHWAFYDGKPIKVQFSKCADGTMFESVKDTFEEEEKERAESKKYMEFESGLQFYYNGSYALMEIRLWDVCRFFGVPTEITEGAVSYFRTLDRCVEIKSQNQEMSATK